MNVPLLCSASQEVVFENYVVGADSSFGGITYWRCQTFTTQVAHRIIKVRLLMAGTGTCTASIRATDVDGKPTGSDLLVKELVITVGETPAWVDFRFATSYQLAAATKYAVVWRVSYGDCVWRGDWSSPSYAGGSYGDDNADGGATWNLDVDIDFLFEEIGYV